MKTLQLFFVLSLGTCIVRGMEIATQLSMFSPDLTETDSLRLLRAFEQRSKPDSFIVDMEKRNSINHNADECAEKAFHDYFLSKGTTQEELEGISEQQLLDRRCATFVSLLPTAARGNLMNALAAVEPQRYVSSDDNRWRPLDPRNVGGPVLAKLTPQPLSKTKFFGMGMGTGVVLGMVLVGAPSLFLFSKFMSSFQFNPGVMK